MQNRLISSPLTRKPSPPPPLQVRERSSVESERARARLGEVAGQLQVARESLEVIAMQKEETVTALEEARAQAQKSAAAAAAAKKVCPKP